jgi:hypothetical protein
MAGCWRTPGRELAIQGGGQRAGQEAVPRPRVPRRRVVSGGSVEPSCVHASTLVVDTDLPIDSVAETSGFSTAANLRKHFSRTVHISPAGYRRTFQARQAS